MITAPATALLLAALMFSCSSKTKMDRTEPPAAATRKLLENRQITEKDTYIVVSVPQQILYLMRNGAALREWPVSTGKAGVGSAAGSNMTPPGTHRIRRTYGENAPAGMIFEGRKPIGKTARVFTDTTDSEEDLVTSRILWLEGLEEGVNRGPGIDSFQRYIYIHGTNEEGLIGAPASHGCIRMRNADVIELFTYAAEGTIVEITDS